MADKLNIDPCGVVFCDIEGTSLCDEDRHRLSHPMCAGVILFSRNYENKKQLIALTQSIKTLKTPELLITVDQEGGRVQRFREEFFKLPPAGWFGDLYNKSAEEGIAAAESGGWLMASECISVGVDLSFAPVLDLDSGESLVIGNRAFHSSVEGVVDLATAWVKGMRKAGMAAVGKHFPGHGFVNADSHLELPEDTRTLGEIQATDMQVFTRLIQSGLQGMMPAHVLYSDVDANPAGFSRFWLQKILRQQLGFEGLIFSDDLSMAGAVSAGTPAERAKAAITAGCDILLVCNNPQAADEVLSSIDQNLTAQNLTRLASMKASKQIDSKQLLTSSEWNEKSRIMMA